MIIIVGQILGLVESETDLVTLCLDTEKEFFTLVAQHLTSGQSQDPQ